MFASCAPVPEGDFSPGDIFHKRNQNINVFLQVW
jgi:hypothetical protein